MAERRDDMTSINMVILPDPDEPEAAEVYVDGQIDRRPYRFLLDTGAARTSVVADDYLSGLEVVGQHGSSGVFAATHDDLITVPDITLGVITHHNLVVTRARSVEGGRGTLLGMDILRHHRLHFLFDQAIMRVDEADDVPPDTVLHPLTFDTKFHPYIEVAFACNGASAQSARVVWDTGASLTVVDLAFINQHPEFFTADGHSTGRDATGAEVETPMYILSCMQPGGITFPSHRVASVDLSGVNAMIELPMDMIMGYSTYRYARWLFDFPRGRWALTQTHF
jgi:hypothetical protein